MIIKIDKTNNLNNIIFDTFLNKEKIEKDIASNPYAIYLIYYEKEVKGYLYYSTIYDRCEINQIEVKEKYRKQKIASKLLTEMINKENKPISLEVRIDNIAAISLYKKFNFEEIAIRKNYYNEIDGILMEKK